METISINVFWLAIYHLIFYKKFYENPFRLCTSELASTYFPFWKWLRGRIVFKSDIYYPYPACIPFLSSFYPTHLITSFLSRFLSVDNAFRLFSIHILLHSFLASILAYFMFLQFTDSNTALFGSLSLGYMAYAIKVFTPAAMYSMAWIPGCFIKGWFGAFSLGMAILGGYWPSLVYMVPFIVISNPGTILGALIGIPQIIPFIWYWPKSVRHKQKLDKNFGRVPLWRYLDFVFPNRTQNTINGVFWPEMAMFIGIVPILMRNFTILWVSTLLVSLTVQIQRIQARGLYLLSFSLIMMVMNNIPWWLISIQAWLLLQNADIYPHFPFCQWWDKPSQIYKKYPETLWPNWTGYLTGKHIKWYEGGFSLK